MGGFEWRLQRALAKEQSDAACLETYGCKFTPFGQGQLSEEFREHLRKIPGCVHLRWLADLLVVRPDLVGKAESMWLVDSKIGRLDTVYWDLEKAAHVAHRKQQEALGLPHVYIWPDGCSCSYVDDLPDDVMKDGPQGRAGSGTPYWLVPKELTRSLESVFGKQIKQEAA